MDRQEFMKQIEDQPFSVLSELVYQYLADAIFEVRLVPDSRINTTKIAEDLGISRTPIRTALDRLTEEQLVEQVGAKGFKVRPVDWKDCMDLYDVRQVLEGDAAYIAANTSTTEHYEKLMHSIQLIKKAQAKGDDLAVFEADNLFHETIVEATGNDYIIAQYRSLKPWIRRYQRTLVLTKNHHISSDQQMVSKHQVIYRLIKNRYSLVVKNEMRDHIHHIYRVLFDRGLVGSQNPERRGRE